MFMIGEFAHMLTASALMATLFLGGWDIPFWKGDNMVVVAPGVVQGAAPAVWKTLLTFVAFAIKTSLFVFLYMWVRWTLPRFRYDQVMDLGWKVLFEVALAFIILMGGSILVLDALGLEFGVVYGLILTAINVVAMVIFFWFVDRDRVLAGASTRRGPEGREREGFVPVLPGEPTPTAPSETEPELEPEYVPAGVE
jgi:NADH-quinone oxidoreductase subunit H